MIELQTSVKQDDTTRTRTPKPGYLNLSIVSLKTRLMSLTNTVQYHGIITEHINRTYPILISQIFI
jgi:hypothetical protein